MPFFPVDDQLSFHPKVIAAGNAAIGLWTRAGSWSKNHATGGLIPTAIARSMGKPAEIRALVEVGLWEEVLPGYQFHDWDHYGANRTGAEEEARRDAKRAADRDRQRRHRAQQDAERDGHGVTERDGHGVTAGVTSRARGPVPSPVPDLPTVDDSSSVPKTSRAADPDQHQLIPHIEEAMRLKVDFRKVASRVAEQAGEPVAPQVVSQIIRQTIARAKARGGDRTGVVLTSVRNDWAEWSKLAFVDGTVVVDRERLVEAGIEPPELTGLDS